MFIALITCCVLLAVTTVWCGFEAFSRDTQIQTLVVKLERAQQQGRADQAAAEEWKLKYDRIADLAIDQGATIYNMTESHELLIAANDQLADTVMELSLEKAGADMIAKVIDLGKTTADCLCGDPKCTRLGDQSHTGRIFDQLIYGD